MAQLIIPQGTLFAGLASVLRNFDSNVTLQQYDLVNVQAGQLEVVDAGEKIAGYINQDGSFTSSSTSVEVDITPFMTVVMDNDNDSATFAATHVGTVFDTIGGTGAQLVDTSSTAAGVTGGTSAGQLLCLAYNPQGVRDDLDSDTSVGLFLIKEAQFGLNA